MQLLLVRHGIAQDAGPATGHQDGARTLTEEGTAKMTAAARGIRTLGLGVDALLTSPLTRCRQTAELLGDALRLAPEDDARLAPGMTLEDLREVLLEYPEAVGVMVCGHQPDLSIIADDLTGAAVEFKKGACAIIDVQSLQPGGGVLAALYPPATLRALGGKA
jgi:phosphohistidine phosphatase